MTWKCQYCSAIHEDDDSCRRPDHVLAKVKYKNLEFFVAGDYKFFQIRQKGEDGWTGRKWLLSIHMTRSEIVQTALCAVLAWEEHEAREHFLYKGQAIYGPHFHVDALLKLAEQGNLDIRS